MTDDLVTWLRTQIDEDERLALAVSDTDWFEAVEPGHFNEFNDEERDHITRHYPARVLRDVEAKRRILDWCNRMDPPYLLGGLLAGEARRVRKWLALPYADRPGYRQEWQPSDDRVKARETQSIPHGTWTRLVGLDLEVYQDTGSIQTIAIGRPVPPTGWQFRHAAQPDG